MPANAGGSADEVGNWPLSVYSQSWLGWSWAKLAVPRSVPLISFSFVLRRVRVNFHFVVLSEVRSAVRDARDGAVIVVVGCGGEKRNECGSPILPG